jgi:pimeloyl-ACP methyl ester carboxylesterase/AraC-like DNA-binding protein
VVIDADASGGFSLKSQFTEADRQAMVPGDGDIIGYHFIRSGRVYARVGDGPELEANAGDIILLPRNDAHLLYTSRDLTPIDSHEVMQQPRGGEPGRIQIDSPGEETSFYCGFLAVSTDHHPLLDSLPPILKLSTSDEARSEWLESSLRVMNQSPDSPDMLARMAELFFAEAVRRYMEQLPPGEGGWLAGLRDPAVARALGIIHGRYAEDLDVEMLAREAGVSRTVLGERFASLLGEPPMRYCARWRMRIAANMLRDGKQSTANIAYSVGFNSEAAFNRAFKREYDVPPATWRRRIEAEAASARGAAERLPEQIVRYCTAKDGTRLAFSAVGDGPPLVKAANWLNHIEHDWKSPVWRHWLQELTRSRCLVRYDERGNGMSDWDSPELTFDAFVEDLESVVDGMRLEQFDLLGISQGASVAIAYAVKHPERVHRLVLCGGYAAGWATRGDPEEIARREAMITLSEAGWGGDSPAYRQLFTNLYIPEGSPQQIDWFTEMERVSASPENAVKLQRVFSKIDVRDLLQKVRVPTLIFHTMGDKVVPFAAGEFLAEHIPGATFVPLESQNHILLETEPAWTKFKEVLRGFLKGDEPSERHGNGIARDAEPREEKRECRAPDGAKLAYAITGAGVPMVKAPTWITHIDLDRTSPVWRGWIAECSRSNRFVRSDMRGFGMSDWDVPEFSFESIVSDLETVIDDAGLGECDLLGVSHGAAGAIAYAARHPERVRKLVLVNSFACGWRVRADPEELSWRTSLMEMNRREWSFRRSLLGEMFIALYYPGADQELIDWHNAHFEQLGPIKNMEAIIEVAADIDVRDELSKVRAPTLVCHANKDGNAPLSAGRAVADGIADARFVELESANHILLPKEPAWNAFTRELRAFLAAD